MKFEGQRPEKDAMATEREKLAKEKYNNMPRNAWGNIVVDVDPPEPDPIVFRQNKLMPMQAPSISAIFDQFGAQASGNRLTAVFRDLEIADALVPGNVVAYQGRPYVVRKVTRDMATWQTEVQFQDKTSFERARRPMGPLDNPTIYAAPLPGEPAEVELPLYEVGVPLVKGDLVVIIAGEQKGLRGVVDRADDKIVAVHQTNELGRTVRVAHKREFIGLIMDAPAIPKFDCVEDAEAWLAVHDRKPRQMHPTGTACVATTPQGTFQGKVVKFMPFWAGAVPGYQLLVMQDGEPKLMEVAAHEIVS